MRRGLLRFLAVALASLIWMAGTATGAGLGGVDLAPDKGPTDPGKGPATAFHVRVPKGGTTTNGFTLTNLTDTTSTVRMYAAGATAQGTPPAITIEVGSVGEAPWLRLSDQIVTLGGNESRRYSLEVADPGGPIGQKLYGAVVLEVTATAVIQRVAVVVYVEVGDPGSNLADKLPLLLVVLAVASVVGAATTFHLSRRRR